MWELEHDWQSLCDKCEAKVSEVWSIGESEDISTWGLWERIKMWKSGNLSMMGACGKLGAIYKCDTEI